MKKIILGLAFTQMSFSVFANNIIDVGVGPAPAYDPLRGTQWALSSTCVDINEAGEAACQTIALGPSYGCGFRNIKTCGSKVKKVALWNGASLVDLSVIEANYDVPVTMNNHGQIGGYGYVGQVYPSEGGNGAIWTPGQDPKGVQSVVISLNDSGDYVLQGAYSSGGILTYTGSAHTADGTEIIYPGPFVRPIAISNNGTLFGAQVLQSFVNEFNTPSGDEVPEVSGVGWLIDEESADQIELNEAGLLDVDGTRMWQARYLRPMIFSSYSTSVNDVNDHDDFTFRYRYSSTLFSGYYCTREGETQTQFVQQPTLPWKCENADVFGGVNYSSRSINGINNIGDAVGVHVPPYSGYHTPPSVAKVWLRNAAGGRDEYDANDLLPANSGYQVLVVKDINDNRQIVADCLNPEGEPRGCIIEVTSPEVPDDKVKPVIKVNNLNNGDELVADFSIKVSAWDDWSRMKKVVFKIDNQRIDTDFSRPYSTEFISANYAAGEHVLKAIAFDNEGNRRTRKVTFNLTSAPVVPPIVIPDPTPNPQPTPPPAGEPVEGEGSITALGNGELQVDGQTLIYNSVTVIKFNDVSGFSVGLPIQYKGVLDENGHIIATDLEVN